MSDNRLVSLVNSFVTDGVVFDRAMFAWHMFRNWGVAVGIWVNTANMPRDSDRRLARITDKYFTGKPNACNNLLKIEFILGEPKAICRYLVADAHEVRTEYVIKHFVPNNNPYKSPPLVSTAEEYLEEEITKSH